MLRRTVFVIFSLLAAGTLLAQAYKWTDENGVVHYSDRPNEGAEEIQLPQSGTRTQSAPVQTVFTADPDAADPAPPFRYNSLTIQSPETEETLWNLEGVLNVSLQISPSLQADHTLNVYFDGQVMSVATPSFQIEEVYRGAHNLQAEILDRNGRLLIRSENTRFYVQQTSVATPQRVVTPPR